jgi:hypothetical protein
LNCVSVELLETEKFQNNTKEKLRAVNKIAAPETTRFFAESEEPFEAMISHPRWRSRQSSGMKIEGGSDSYEN